MDTQPCSPTSIKKTVGQGNLVGISFHFRSSKKHPYKEGDVVLGGEQNKFEIQSPRDSVPTKKGGGRRWMCAFDTYNNFFEKGCPSKNDRIF